MERKWIKYPEQDLVSTRGGMKVGFRTYSSEATANECAAAAENNRDIKLDQGHDFGYMWPGEITQDGDLWEVTIP
jgi:hypothetical protein